MRFGIVVAVLMFVVFAFACGRGKGVVTPIRGTTTAPAPPKQGERLPAPRYIQLPEGMTPGVDYREDEIIVGFKLQGFANPSMLTGGSNFNKGAMLNPVLYENQAIAEFAREIASKHGLTIIPNGEGYVKNVNFCGYRLSPGQDANAVAALLRLKYADKVKYVEYNGIVRPAYWPDDPYYMDGSLWGLDTIRTDLAWDVTTGDANQWIAVIDTGIRMDHEDLAGNWGYIDGINTDLFRGDQWPDDEQGHGTHVAGTIAAIGDNATGVVGVAYGSKVLPIKVFGTKEEGGTNEALEATAILLASQAGCIIANLSLGGPYASRTVAEVCRQAFENGMMIVASAMNENTNWPYYPASHPEVISVGASDINDSRTSYSNYGLALDTVAPGGDSNGPILSTWFTAEDAYSSISGTSMASPHVAGVAALIRAKSPALTPLEVRALIEYFGDDVLIQSEWQAALPIYRLNAYTPLTYTVSGLPTVSVTNHSDYDQVSGDFTIQVNANATTAVAGVHWYVDGEYLGWIDAAPYDLSSNTEALYLVPGEHTFTAEVLDTENAHGYDSVILDVVDVSLTSPYWTGFEDVPEQEGWWQIDYSNSNSFWQYESAGPDTVVYFGDISKPGGRGYYQDDIDVLGSPAIDLTGLTAPKLYLTSKWDMDAYDSMDLAIANGGYEEVYFFQYISTPQRNQNPEWPDFGLYQIDLANFEGTKIMLEFWTDIYETTSEGQGFWLDNVVISDSTGPPQVIISPPTPAANSLVQGTVTLNASAVDDNDIVLASEYRIGSNVIKTFGGAPSQFAWNSASVPDGDRMFTAEADDELSYYGYYDTGTASRTFYVHNTAPSGISIVPAAERIGQPVTITGSHFGKAISGQTFVYFTGASGDVPASVTSWSNTSIDCTVPLGAIDGPVKVKIGALTGSSSSDFVVEPSISGFEFTSPAEGTLVDAPINFILAPQPYADWVEFEILGHPEIAIPDDNSPSSIMLTLDPSDFPRNGAYTIQATAFAPGEQQSATLEFFVLKLPGDFNGDGIVNQADLDFLRPHLWESSGSPTWIPYLDANRDGVINELDAFAVGYHFGET
ncbi:MAG: S8 family serine peptidase [bacterium]|jgi:subtilisin family serine protease